MKRKIVILTVTTLMTISMVGCVSQKNKEMQDTMNNVSDTLNKIDSNFNKKTLTYEDSQKLIENISSQLSEFKPEVTPDKQTIILNLATREISGEIGREYIMINMVANKTDYTIQVSGNIFRDKYGKVPKNDATVRALYDLLIDTNSISGLNINEYIEMINDQSLAKKK
ncbi:putative lipoprotein [[Clostridium] sordellii ATCC 9714]|nr:putative lipoprotein [[Clostridium] sordellii ATCC 9714] [Paeniclostridium sordellii ATCC 9714]